MKNRMIYEPSQNVNVTKCYVAKDSVKSVSPTSSETKSVLRNHHAQPSCFWIRRCCSEGFLDFVKSEFADDLHSPFFP